MAASNCTLNATWCSLWIVRDSASCASGYIVAVLRLCQGPRGETEVPQLYCLRQSPLRALWHTKARWSMLA